MIRRRWSALSLFAMLVAMPASAQEDWLPAEPPAGLALRIWLTGPEAATVDLAVRIGGEPWCAISGKFSPEHHGAPNGRVAAGTPCGLDQPTLERILAPDAPVPIQLKGTVHLGSGRVVRVSQTVDTNLSDVWDASIEFSRDAVVFVAAQG